MDVQKQSQIEQIKERWSKATPGPWMFNKSGFISDCHFMAVCRMNETNSFRSCGKSLSNGEVSWENNAAAIASVPTDIAYLLERVERQEKIIEKLTQILGFSISCNLCIQVKGKCHVTPVLAESCTEDWRKWLTIRFPENQEKGGE